MKQITRQERDFIINMGLDKPYCNAGCKGISRTKGSAKTYYAIDYLAFAAWEALGIKTDDKDYLAYLANKK